jgi:hypothetical protein
MVWKRLNLHRVLRRSKGWRDHEHPSPNFLRRCRRHITSFTMMIDDVLRFSSNVQVGVNFPTDGAAGMLYIVYLLHSFHWTSLFAVKAPTHNLFCVFENQCYINNKKVTHMDHSDEIPRKHQ